MKILSAIFLIAFCTSSIMGLSVDGVYMSSSRFAVYDSFAVSRLENSVKLSSVNEINSEGKFRLNCRVIQRSDEDIIGIESLKSMFSFEKTEFFIDEAELSLYGLFGGFVDIRTGKIRVNWGVGDVISPADIINPYDLRDKWTYETRMGSYGVDIDMFIGGYQTSFFFSPYFQPNLLPGIDGNVTEGIPKSADFTSEIIMPGKSLNERFSAAFMEKISTGEWSFSFIYGYIRDNIPWTSRVEITQGYLPIFLYVNAELFYPRLHMGALNARGSILGAGFWAEAAAFFPEENSYSIDMTGIGRGVSDTFNIKDRFYVKAVFGIDYLFDNGFYLNLQYLHGFPGEFGEENISEYILASLKMPFGGGKIDLSLFDMSIGIEDEGGINERFSLVYTPAVTIKAAEGAYIKLRYLEYAGTDKSLLANVSDDEGMEISAKVFF